MLNHHSSSSRIAMVEEQEGAEGEPQQRCDLRSYTVHVYAVVIVMQSEIQAVSQQEAIRLAGSDLDLYHLFDRLDSILPVETDVSYAEEITGYLVDEQGDPEHENTRYYCRHRQPAAFGLLPCECGEHEH